MAECEPCLDLEIDLATQLALTTISDGFMGMASGLCTAANLSEVPHVIFKHPAHHSAAMAIELGSSVNFPLQSELSSYGDVRLTPFR